MKRFKHKLTKRQQLMQVFTRIWMRTPHKFYVEETNGVKTYIHTWNGN